MKGQHMDITTRYITTLRAAGFNADVVGTGGNCEALEVTAGNLRVLVTDDAQLPDSADYCCVGLYDDQGDIDYADADLATVADVVRDMLARVA